MTQVTSHQVSFTPELDLTRVPPCRGPGSCVSGSRSVQGSFVCFPILDKPATEFTEGPVGRRSVLLMGNTREPTGAKLLALPEGERRERGWGRRAEPGRSLVSGTQRLGDLEPTKARR